MKRRAELSKKNPYWIPKHRYYELRHFCLQYPAWKEAYYSIGYPYSVGHVEEYIPVNYTSDPTGRTASSKAAYKIKMELVEQAANLTDPYLGKYILQAVTEDLSYNYFQTVVNIPCCRGTYFEMYRRFFWLLDNSQNMHIL